MATKLEKLIQQQERIKLEIAKEKRKLTGIEKKEDTRRKILTGAVVLTAMESDTQLRNRVNKLLKDKLIRDNDRKLFGLEPLGAEPLETNQAEHSEKKKV